MKEFFLKVTSEGGSDMSRDCVLETNISAIKLLNRGKVRDIYEIDDIFLIVTTDRISAFDCVLPNGIPDKGKLLTEISLFWFRFIGNNDSHHLITANFEDFPECVYPYREQLEGRTLCVKKARPFAIEFIVRGYLTGSAWLEYQEKGTVCGISCPQGMQKDQKFDEPLFTPSTKADKGHDENISFEQCQEIIGEDVAFDLKERSLELYKKASDYTHQRGIILCDTKFEFGCYGDDIILIDEVLTPDSSRFWESDNYVVGQSNKSFDKQIVRDYLAQTDWDKKYPAPFLPEDIVQLTCDRYREIINRLTS